MNFQRSEKVHSTKNVRMFYIGANPLSTQLTNELESLSAIRFQAHDFLNELMSKTHDKNKSQLNMAFLAIELSAVQLIGIRQRNQIWLGFHSRRRTHFLKEPFDFALCTHTEEANLSVFTSRPRAMYRFWIEDSKHEKIT